MAPLMAPSLLKVLPVWSSSISRRAQKPAVVIWTAEGEPVLERAMSMSVTPAAAFVTGRAPAGNQTERDRAL